MGDLSFMSLALQPLSCPCSVYSPHCNTQNFDSLWLILVHLLLLLWLLIKWLIFDPTILRVIITGSEPHEVVAGTIVPAHFKLHDGMMVLITFASTKPESWWTSGSLSFSDSKLVPDLSTEIGKEVSKWRKILDSVPVELVSFGILYYRDLAAPGHKLPWALRYMVMGRAGKFDTIHVCVLKVHAGLPLI